VAHWLAELRRRNVHGVLIAYLAIAWLLAQVAEFLAEAFAWPTWVLRAVVAALLLGLPAAAVVAWFFEITTGGLVREQAAPSGAAGRTRRHRPWQDARKEKSAGDSPATMAVLSFRPTVASSSDEALEFGMADTLITRLSGLAGVIVSPLSSVRRYATLEQDPIAAGRDLGVESVLDGSIQRSGDRLRVTARLIRVKDGQQLWSDRFDQKSTDIFEVQDSIADRVCAALALKLSPAEKQRLGRRATNDAAAYDLFLKGRYYWNRRASSEDLRSAIDSYARAVGRDPQFALAYSGLADALALQGVFGIRAPQDVYPKALDAANRALELDPGLAEAHATRGHLRVNFLYDWRGAMEDYDAAIRYEPRYPASHMWRGFWLLFVGRGDEGLAELKTARDLEPDSLALAANYARGLYWHRRYDEADAQLSRVLEMEPKSGLARSLLVSSRAAHGKFDEALALLSQAAPVGPGSRGLTGVVLANAGHGNEARAELAKLEELAKREYVSAYDLASIEAALGDADGAFAWLDRAIAERSSLLPTLRVDPVMDGLRSDPRYVTLENRIGFPPR
jgi:TolB-like protein/Tfp pilus assembly protein PilF